MVLHSGWYLENPLGPQFDIQCDLAPQGSVAFRLQGEEGHDVVRVRLTGVVYREAATEIGAVLVVLSFFRTMDLSDLWMKQQLSPLVE